MGIQPTEEFAPVTTEAELSAVCAIIHATHSGVLYHRKWQTLQQESGKWPPDTPLPEAVAAGAEPFLVIGAVAGE